MNPTKWDTRRATGQSAASGRHTRVIGHAVNRPRTTAAPHPAATGYSRPFTSSAARRLTSVSTSTIPARSSNSWRPSQAAAASAGLQPPVVDSMTGGVSGAGSSGSGSGSTGRSGCATRSPVSRSRTRRDSECGDNRCSGSGRAAHWGRAAAAAAHSASPHREPARPCRRAAMDEQPPQLSSWLVRWSWCSASCPCRFASSRPQPGPSSNSQARPSGGTRQEFPRCRGSCRGCVLGAQSNTSWSPRLTGRQRETLKARLAAVISSYRWHETGFGVEVAERLMRGAPRRRTGPRRTTTRTPRP